MKLLSWDVGIINLAYCLLEYDNNQLSILDWDVINLTNRDNEKCDCGAKPMFYIESNKKYYCKTHGNQVDTTTADFNVLFQPNISNNCIKCDKKCKFVYNNEYFCTMHSKLKYKTIINENQLKKYNMKNIKNLKMDNILLQLVKELDKRPLLLDCNFVYIENQPSIKNPKMKTISSMVYDYYMIRGMIDSHITAVHFISPRNKTKLANEDELNEMASLTKEKKYKYTKQLGIKYCRKTIENMPQWLNKFDNSKKQDDLADCFLQGFYVIQSI